MVNVRIFSSILPLCMAVCLSQAVAAETVLWDENGIDTFVSKGLYEYSYPDKATVSVSLSKPKDTVKPYYLQATFVAQEGSKNSGAGFGFSWELDEDYDPRVVNLANYSGVCLNYAADGQVRMDFKQWSIDDDNYFGILLPGTGGQKVNKFVAFEDLELGWDQGKSTNRWDVKKQLGLQFSYKSDFIKKNGLRNVFGLYAVRLADECPQHAPVADASVPTEYDLNEGEKLVLHMSDIFSDEDGTDLSISGTFSGNGDVISSYDDTQHITLKDSIELTVNPNPSSAVFTMTLTATDPTGRKVKWTFTVNPIDVAHAPTLKDSTFEVLQGETISCSGKCSFYDLLAFDLDGDEFTLHLVDEPTVGDFTFNAAKGQFSYTAPADFFGEVSFSLYADEDNDPTSKSATVEYKITVLDINDPPVATIEDPKITYTIGEGNEYVVTLNDPKSFIEVDEDFTDSIWVSISVENVIFSDVDSDFDMGVKTNGLVKAEIKKIGKEPFIVVTSKLNANGLAKVTYYADDGEFQAGVDFYVQVKSVVDDPIAVADAYELLADEPLTVAAKNGVLANDENPDDPSVPLIPVVDKNVSHGKLKMKEDGGFTYTPEEGFTGTDSFTYYVHPEEDEDVTSETVKVTLTVKSQPGPVVEVDPKSLEFTLVEDAKQGQTFLKAVVMNWFSDPDDNPFTVSAESDDGKTLVEFNASGSLVIKVAPDSVGDAYVTVSAKGDVGKAAEFKIHVTITPVNDAPVVLKTDSVYVKDLDGWKVKFALADYVTDIDGDSLTFTAGVSSALATKVSVTIENDTVKVKPKDKAYFQKGDLVAFNVKAADAKTYATVNFFIFVGMEKPSVGIRTIAAAPKMGWQGAIAADRGVAAMMDMQGRVMWKAKLPVSEADVRNAAAQVQGRKILRVNNQTWTIK